MSGPSTPAPASPGTPGGQPSSLSGGAPQTGQPSESPDLLVWDYWWTFNRHAYLNLRDNLYGEYTLTGSDEFYLGHGTAEQSVDVLRPSERAIRETVVPALVRALETERQNDVQTASLIALAKIGEERAGLELAPLFVEFLDDSSQEVAETAAVSLGILASESAVPMLVALLNDTDVARRQIRKDEIPLRTRAFAAYGLGLIGAGVKNDALRQEIVGELIDVLDSPHFSQRDIKVAAMVALGLTPLPIEAVRADAIEASASDDGVLLSRADQLAFLLDYFDERGARANRTTRHEFVRSHAPTALARLLQGAPAELAAPVVEALIDGIAKHSKLRDELQMSCVLALGQLGDASKDEGVNDDIRSALVRTIKDGDQQSRRFALIALAQSNARLGGGPDPDGGTAEVRDLLLRQLSRGKTQMKSWAALALGVLGRGLLDGGREPDAAASRALLAATVDHRRPSDIGAYVTALGMRRDPNAGDVLRDKLAFFKGSDEAQGYTAVALGMTGDRAAIEDLRAVVRRARYRPDLIRMTAVGLGLLGDKDLVPELVSMLGEAKSLATQASVATALGNIGDARSVGPLAEMLADGEITATARAFAAAALGIVCDKEDLVWNAKISRDINYRANTVTLTGSGNGVLDIL